MPVGEDERSKLLFSQRFARLDTAASPLAAQAARIRASGGKLVDLTVSNPTQVGLHYPDAAVREAMTLGAAQPYEPEPRGLLRSRESVAAYYSSRGCSVSPENVLLTASTSEAYSFLFKLLADPGDEILAPVPSYPLFDYLTMVEALRLVPYPLHWVDGWHLDLAALEDAITERTRVLLVVHPNNPTGHYLSRVEWTAVQEIALRNGLAIVVDEVFFDYSFAPTHNDSRPVDLCGGTVCPTFVLNGLSKTAGLPQLKLAWIAAAGPSEQTEPAMDRLEVISDTFLSVSSPVQHALPRLLELAPIFRTSLLARISDSWRQLQETRLEFLEAEGGWTALLRMPAVRSGEEWATHLLEAHGVLVHPGELFGFSSPHLVLSTIVEADNFAAGLTAFQRL